jgi:hypothetical protein
MVNFILVLFFSLLGPVLLIGHMVLILMGWWDPGAEGPLFLVAFIALSNISLFIAHTIDSSTKDTTPCEPS